MKVSREKLIDLASTETEKRADNGDVISAYIIGSVASGDPIIGGTADVDLVLIHEMSPPFDREIHPLSMDFHLDITHHSTSMYERPTELRIDPWLGPTMCEPIFLYDPDHFFERAQAGVRGRFHRTDFVHERAQAFLSRAREDKTQLESNDVDIQKYLKVLLESTNVIVTLSGFPAAGRRLVQVIEARLEKFGASEFFTRFLQLHGIDRLMEGQVEEWIEQWVSCSQDVTSEEDQSAIARQRYYLSGFEIHISQGTPGLTLWNLLDKWADTIQALNATTVDGKHRDNFEQALVSLGFSVSEYMGRLDELESYLDDIEEYLEIWAHEHGA